MAAQRAVAVQLVSGCRLTLEFGLEERNDTLADGLSLAA